MKERKFNFLSVINFSLSPDIARACSAVDAPSKKMKKMMLYFVLQIFV